MKRLNREASEKWFKAIVCPREFVEKHMAAWEIWKKDRTPDWTYTRYNLIIRHVKGRVCDVGCNAGGLTCVYTKKKNLDFVVGVDALPWHLERAWEDSKDLRKQIDWVAGCGGDLPLPDESFDTVVMSELLEHTFNPLTTMVDGYRLVKKGGQLLLINQDKADPKYRPNWCRDQMNPCNIDEILGHINNMTPKPSRVEKFHIAPPTDSHKGWFIRIIK